MPIYVYNAYLTSLVWAEYEIPIQTAFTCVSLSWWGVGGGRFSRDLLFLLNAAASVQSERGIPLRHASLQWVGRRRFELWNRVRSSSSSSGTSLRGKCSAVRRRDTRLSLHPQPAGLLATERYPPPCRSSWWRKSASNSGWTSTWRSCRRFPSSTAFSSVKFGSATEASPRSRPGEKPCYL